MQRRIEHTMAFSLFLEPKQEVHLFQSDQLFLPNFIATERGGDGVWAKYLRIVNDWWGALLTVAISTPMVSVRIDERDRGLVADHCGPWMKAGRNLSKPVVIRRQELLDVSARALPGFSGEVVIHLGWKFGEVSPYEPPSRMVDVPAWDDPPPGADPSKR